MQLVRVLLLLACAGCTPIAHVFACHGDASCGAGGRCEPAGWCSFADASCAGGRRYGQLSGGGLGGACVTGGSDGGSGSDGGVACPLGDPCCAGMSCAAPLRCSGAVCQGCVLALALGDNHGCALKPDGTLWCWGANDHGQLGDGSTAMRPAAVQVVDEHGQPLGGFVAVTAGANHTCALTAGGVIYCWGDDSDGELGRGDNAAVNPVPMPAALSSVAAVAAGARHTCAALTAGAGSLVWCFGANDAGQLASATPGGSSMPVAAVDRADAQLTARALAGGFSHTCMLKTDGSAWCWGSDTMGELGDGASAAASPPVQVAAIGAHARALAAGTHYTCALLDDGSIDCFGQDDRAQAGQPAGAPVAVARSVGLAGATAVAAGATLACARQAGARLSCWGDGATPAPVGSGAGAIAVGANDRCAARADGIDCVVADPRLACP